MSEEITFTSGGREIRATLYGRFSRGVLLCPPHPLYGGSRNDSRLVAIAGALESSGIYTLCFDYSAYTGGTQEVQDALAGLEYMAGTSSSPGLLGYSYGAVVASNAAARFPGLKGLVLVSPLAKIDRLKTELSSDCRKMIVYGRQDELVAGDIDALYTSAAGEKQKLELDTGHFYEGYEEILAGAVRDFFLEVFGVRFKPAG